MSDSGKKNFLKTGLVFLASCIFAAVILEIFLDNYKPVQPWIRRNRLIIINEGAEGYNSLGFRGAEPPVDRAGLLTAFTVGGSTTHSPGASGFTWTDFLGFNLEKTFSGAWINNAGMPGHNTYGHQLLLENALIPFKPKAVFFLTGVNDMLTPESVSRNNARMMSESWYLRAVDYAAAHSGIGALIKYIFVTPIFNRIMFAMPEKEDDDDDDKDGDGDSQGRKDIKKLIPKLEIFSSYLGTDREKEIPATGIDMKKGVKGISEPKHKKELLERHYLYSMAYKLRVKKLIDTCKKNDIKPVLITQPLLCGKGKDPATGTDLGTFVYPGLWRDDFSDCSEYWSALEMYNDRLRELSSEEKVPLSDLARELPKDSRLFTDIMHFTDLGQYMIGRIIYKDVCGDLVDLSPGTYGGSCRL